MKQHWPVLIFIVALILGGCVRINPTNLPAIPFMVTITPETVFSFQVEDTPGLLPATESATQTAEMPTSVPLHSTATEIIFVPTATETLIPAPELPTEQPNPPVFMVWSGTPTYPGDSEPGYLFRVNYDPEQWAQAINAYDDIVLANRSMEYCIISPWTGRGLPVDWKTTHEFRAIGSSSFDVNTVSAQGQVKFITYTGGEGRIVTGFQVSFIENQDACVQEAEAILGTLRSFAAIPTATPTPETPAELITPTP